MPLFLLIKWLISSFFRIYIQIVKDQKETLDFI